MDPRQESLLVVDPRQESLGIKAAEQQLWARGWITFAVIFWLGTGILSLIGAAVITLYLFAKGQLEDLPTGLKWLLGIWFGGSGVGTFFMRNVTQQVVDFWFPHGRIKTTPKSKRLP